MDGGAVRSMSGGPSPAAGLGRIKGAAIREFLRWYVERVGEARAAELFRQVPSPHRAFFDPSSPTLGVLASTWYPAPAMHALCDAVTGNLAPSQQLVLAREGSRALMESTLRGVYRFLLQQMVSPERFAALAPRVWRTYFDSGDRSTDIVSPGRHDGIIRDWAGHHPFICAVQVHATTWIYENTGCKQVATFQTDCVSRGSAFCKWTTTWRG